MNHLQQYLVDEFIEDYQEGEISRRQAIKRIAGITGLAAAIQLLAACGQPVEQGNLPTAGAAATPEPNATAAPAATLAAEATALPAATTVPEATVVTAPTAAPVSSSASPDSVAEGDPSVTTERVTFQGGDVELLGYLARPSAEGTFPLVLVCHENRGLTPYIEDVTRRVAKAGYVALAVDLLSREGGFAKVADPDSIPGLLSGAPPEQHVSDFTSGLTFLKSQPYAKADRAGMVGFCFGGGVTWLCAAGIPELRAAVPFYGPPAPESELPKINAAVLAIYGELDSRITGTADAIEAAMQQNNKTFRKIIYPGANHAFHNDTGTRYNAEAAQAAWRETLAWFGQYLNA